MNDIQILNVISIIKKIPYYSQHTNHKSMQYISRPDKCSELENSLH